MSGSPIIGLLCKSQQEPEIQNNQNAVGSAQVVPEGTRSMGARVHRKKTPEAKDAVWKRYAAEKANPKPNRRQRRGSTLDPVTYRPLTREQRARLSFLAEKFDAHTRDPGKHGGCLKRTGLYSAFPL